MDGHRLHQMATSPVYNPVRRRILHQFAIMEFSEIERRLLFCFASWKLGKYTIFDIS
jgi:hypothetical protein